MLLIFDKLELLVTGFAGESGSRILYQNNETRKKLLDVYPKSFFAVLGDVSGHESGKFSGNESGSVSGEIVGNDSGDDSEKDSRGIPLSGGQAAGEVPGVKDRENAAEGGVYGALWRLLHRNALGAAFSRRAIPVRQQTVELCECLGLDPCRLPAENCTVWLVTDPAPLLEKAEKAGFPARVIGYTEKGPAIRRTDGETVSFLRKS